MSRPRSADVGAALHQQAGRAFFRHHVENGLAVTAALGAVAALAWLAAGVRVAVLASIGAMCVSLLDQPAPLAVKFRAMSAALAGATLVTLLAGLASRTPWAMAAVIALTSIGLALATAFGRTALTLGIAGVLALVIGLALPAATPHAALARAATFLVGGAAYEALAMILSVSMMGRTRRTALNEAMIAFAAFLRQHAGLYDPATCGDDALAAVIDAHGVLTERLQSAREIIFRGPRDARWTGATVALIDAYETVLASDADWEESRRRGRAPALERIAALTRVMANDVDATALALVAPMAEAPICDYGAPLAALDAALAAESDDSGLQATRETLAHASLSVARLARAVSPEGAVTRVPAGVDVAAFLLPSPPIRATLRAHARWTSPVVRYGIRLTLAMLAGFAVTRALPRFVHGGWVLLTIALIMRSSYAVTLQRRNDRLLGTLAGCALAAVLIPVLPVPGIVLGVVVGVGVAHAYASVNYRITSFAASAMALMLLHFLEPAAGFVAQRIVDTAIGGGISMVFAFVLPNWEWRDVPRLVAALLEADRGFAAAALSRAPPEQAYRLARKRALDAFTALAATTRRLPSEPKRYAGDLAALARLLGANYLFVSDLAAVRSLLRSRYETSDADAAQEILETARPSVLRALAPPPMAGVSRPTRPAADLGPGAAGSRAVALLDRRLRRAESGAARVAAEAARAGGAGR